MPSRERNRELEDACLKLAKWAEENPMIRSLTVFGSRAKGTARRDSDIDIAIIVDYSKEIRDSTNEAGEKIAIWIEKVPQWRAELCALLGIRIGLHELKSKSGSPHVWQYVKDSHISVYDPLCLLKTMFPE